MPSTATRSRTAPLAPRRLSGPTRRVAPAGPQVRGRTGAFERIARFPDHFLVDRVLRSRACIWLIGIMLGGIVAMQVSLLRLNTGITRAVQTQTTLGNQNASLQDAISRLTAADRVRDAAADADMIDPPAGSTRYLHSRGIAVDGPLATKRIKPPSALAQAIQNNHGIIPGSLAEPNTAAAALAGQLAGTGGTTPATNVAPAATPTALPTPAATPQATPVVPTPTPAIQQAAPTPTPVG